MAVKQNSCNLLAPTPYIVSSTAGSGTYKTIQSAMDAATAAGGGTVLINPGTYTENLYFYGNVNLTALLLGSVTIVGTGQLANIGTIEITNINFVAALGQVIIFQAATASTTVEALFNNCNFLGSTGVALLDVTTATGSCVAYFNNCVIQYSGTGASAFNWTNGALNISNTLINGTGAAAFILNGSCQLALNYCSVFPGNYPAVTLAGSTSYLGSYYNTYFNGTAAVFHFTAGATVESYYDNITCSNASGYWADQTAGVGSVKYGFSLFRGTATHVDPGLSFFIPNLQPLQGGVTWQTVTSNTQMYPNNGYIVISGNQTLTMPTKSVIGDAIKIVLRGGVSWTIAQNAGQQLYVGPLFSTSGTGGSIASSSAGDCVSLVCTVTTTTWQAESAMGNLLIT